MKGCPHFRLRMKLRAVTMETMECGRLIDTSNCFDTFAVEVP